MDRIILVNTNTFHGFTIEEALPLIKKAGFKYIELTATKGWTEHVFPNQSFEYLSKIKALIEELGLTVIGFSGHTSLMDQNRLKDFILNMELANFFNAKYIVSSIGEAHIKNDNTSSNNQLIENLKYLIPYLKKYNLELALETHGTEFADGESLNKIVNAVNSDLIKINLDTANVLFYGNKLPEDDLLTCVDNVSYMHIKDKGGKTNEWNFPAIGKGYINFEKIFDILNKKSNNCPLSIEIEFTEKGVSDITEVYQALKDSYETLEKLKMI
ncbi:MAG: sugar phosphate isomerase/epimerase family protein [Pleomorphochaeta sp.]